MKDFANLKKYATQNLQIECFSTKNLVFMGDSITEFWKTSNPIFFSENDYINRGISGQTSSQILLRFQQDVINLKPKRVIILAGINDIAENNGEITISQIMQNISLMCDMALKNEVKVFLCSVLPANKFPWRLALKPADKIAELNNRIKNYCLKNKIPYLDYYSKMVDADKGLNSKFTNDGVHPNSQGYLFMQSILLENLVGITQ